MVQLTVRLTAAAGHGHDMVSALHTLMRHARRRSGCAGAHIAADVDEANTFWYSEDWDRIEDLEPELRAERFSQLLALMETSAQRPMLEFRMVGETRGLEYISAVREAAETRER